MRTKGPLLALVVVPALLLAFAVVGQEEQETPSRLLVVLPASGDADAQEALAVGQRLLEARLSATGRFRFMGDSESQALFDGARADASVSPEAQREAQLDAARRGFADWAIEIGIDEVERRQYLVTLDVWNPVGNERLHSDSELVTDAGSMSAGARIGLDRLGERFLISPLVIGEGGDLADQGGRLDVLEVAPVGARLYINNREVGPVPAQFSNLPTGTVQIEIRAHGYETETRTMELSAGEVLEIRGVRLEPTSVTIEVRANISGAAILVDDETIATTDAGEFVSFEVPATAERLRITRDGYQPYSTRLSLVGQTTRRFEVTLSTHVGPDGQDVSTADCTRVSPSDGGRVCEVPAGSFVMGSTSDAARSDEGPQRTVELHEAVWMYESEVTVGMYRRCVEAGACVEPGFGARGSEGDTGRSHDVMESCSWGAPGREEYPMNCVNWYGARAYCQWAGGDLPTEAEWEHAARGTDAREFAWAPDADAIDATCELAISAECPSSSDGPAPTGERTLGRSPYGLHDVTGNISEWVLDTYESGAYLSLPATDPVSETGSSRRVVRGGSFREFPDSLRVTARARLDAQARADHVGFRCVLSHAPEPR